MMSRTAGAFLLLLLLLVAANSKETLWLHPLLVADAASSSPTTSAPPATSNIWPTECRSPLWKKPTTVSSTLLQSECASAAGTQPFDDLSLGFLTKIKCYYVLTSLKRNTTNDSSGGGGGTEEATFNFSMLRAIELTYQGEQTGSSPSPSPSPPAVTTVTHGTGLTTFKTSELSLNRTDYLTEVTAYSGRTLFAISFHTKSGSSISCGDMGSLVSGTDYNAKITTLTTQGNFFGSVAGVQIQRSSDTDKSFCGVTSVPSLVLYEFPGSCLPYAFPSILQSPATNSSNAQDGGSSDDGGGLSVGTIIGVTIAAISALLFIVGIVLFIFFWRRRKRAPKPSALSPSSSRHLADPQHLRLRHHPGVGGGGGGGSSARLTTPAATAAAEVTVIADPLLLPFPTSSPIISATAEEDILPPTSASLPPPVIARRVEMPLYDGRFIIFPAARAADVGAHHHPFICPHHDEHPRHPLRLQEAPSRGTPTPQYQTEAADWENNRSEGGVEDLERQEGDEDCWFCRQQRDDNHRRRRLFANKCATNAGIAAGIVEDEFRSEFEDSDYHQERQI